MLQTPQLGIIYFFFNHAEHEQTAENVIRVLLRRLLDQLGRIPDEVQKEYSRYQSDPHNQMPDQTTYGRLLKRSVADFSRLNGNRVFILMDAYDEFLSGKEEKVERATEERTALRECLSSLLIETDYAKLLITTRPQYLKELQDTFPKSNIANIHGDEKDMRTYISSRLKRFPGLTDALKKCIMDKLLQANEQGKWQVSLHYWLIEGFCF